MKITLLTDDEIAWLQSLVRYDPKTGQFFWRVDRGAFKAGDQLKYRRKDGYGGIFIRFSSRKFRLLTGRAAWILMTGSNPAGEIDHRDNHPENDCWANLRDATSSQQKANRRVRKDSKTGIKGVSLHKKSGLWRARHGAAGATTYHRTKDMAAEAYALAASRVYGEFARAG